MMRFGALAAVVLLLAGPAMAQSETERAGPPPQATCDQPVIMVVTGLTLDRERMGQYARAIAESKIYEELGGYYLNIPRTLEIFDGTEDPRHTTLNVRFPCLENARAFWYSKTYQETILPLRQNPSAGDYSVRVYPEAPLREDMVGKVGDNTFVSEFPADGVEQIER
ncbi:DUF1330 domain-containing protein [uncultured Erythrobacter sp.]|uniref:DUF1330 domain-containing protein n=1 Tax=uncultured Erythrobacter sp. TaxID=263913 RepID=UPI00261EB61E|nr:DUF1330 domain-containing protein [uncultured Erythrobacter sp.]